MKIDTLQSTCYAIALEDLVSTVSRALRKM